MEALRSRGRALGLIFAGLFIPSTALLLIASTAYGSLPAWGGIADLALVILIAFVGFWIRQIGRVPAESGLHYQTALYLFNLILVGMWLLRERIDFNLLLPGVA